MGCMKRLWNKLLDIVLGPTDEWEYQHSTTPVDDGLNVKFKSRRKKGCDCE